MNDLFVDDDPELRDALHAAVSGGPVAPPVQDLLAHARRAHHRQGVRRAAAGLAVAAALAVAAVTGVQALTGPSADRTGQVAQEPTPPEQLERPSDLGVHVTEDGRLVASPGTEIVRSVSDPIPSRPGVVSWGVVVERAGVEAWGLLSRSPEGTLASVEPPRTRFASFEDWLDYEVAAVTGEPEPHLVAFRPDGSLRPTGAGRIVKEGTGVPLGPLAEGTRTAAAEVLIHGERRWVLAALAPSGLPTYVVLRGDRVPDFDTLVDQAPDLFAGATR